MFRMWKVQLINDKKSILLLELDSTVHCSDIFQRNDIFSVLISRKYGSSFDLEIEEKRKKKEGQYKGA